MKRMLLKLKKLKVYSFFRYSPSYVIDLIEIKRQQKRASIEFKMGRFFPILGDRFADSGSAKGHYFHQDLLIASRIFKNSPDRHVDIGSRIDGFVAHVAAFREIEVFDIRSLESTSENIKFVQADMMNELDSSLNSYCDSVSCLHALEHFGLGRYGDPVKFDGYLDGFRNIGHILKPGGKLYLSVPIGEQRIEFNAHRVFSIEYLLTLLEGLYSIDMFSYVDDEGDLHKNISLESAEARSNFHCRYGCGIFEMTKL